MIEVPDSPSTSHDGKASPRSKPRRTLQTVERALAILSRFTDESPDFTINDLVARLGLSRPTVYRLLATMEETGYVERDAISQRFRPGLGIVSLASIALNHMTLRRQAIPEFYYFVNRLHLGAGLGVLRHGEVYYLAHSPHPKTVDLVFQVGRCHPLHATALGKALLMGFSTARVEALLRETDLRSYTPYTLTRLQDIVSDVERARERGYAFIDQELCLRWCSIAAPIRDRTSRVVAALGISAPNTDVRSEAIASTARLVMEAADRVAYKLGYPLAGTQERWTPA